VLRQSYDRLELIVVGDGCTDETAAAVSRIRDDRLRFINLAQRGCYPEDPMLRWMVAGTPAMNQAMAMARGQYVTHLDDDDEYLPDRLEKLVRFAAEHECDFMWHPFWQEGPAGQWELREASSFSLGQITTSSVFYRAWLTRFRWNLEAYRLREPGDWNRFRRIKHLGLVSMRYPEPLLRHYRERSQVDG
jgi:glycosyltransferase involved in cell wall biosynthesis